MSRHAIAADAAQFTATADSRHPSQASALAVEVQALIAAGDRETARDRFGALVSLLQRRALRLAFHYLRDAADADDVVQEAFIKVFVHIEDYRRDRPFDLWFTRVLVNTAIDRLKSRTRHRRWTVGASEDDERTLVERVPDRSPSAERRVLAMERWQHVIRAVATLPDRQRLVFTLCHIDQRSAAEISAVTGMHPATVRVHLFRALRQLRAVLGGRR